jgi:hypothetical protein
MLPFDRPDGTFMHEEANQTRDDGTPYINRYLNSGNFFLRSNARTRRLMDMWLLGYKFPVGRGGARPAARRGFSARPALARPAGGGCGLRRLPAELGCGIWPVGVDGRRPTGRGGLPLGSALNASLRGAGQPPSPSSKNSTRAQSQTSGNQLWLNRLEGMAYKLCLSPAACARAAAEGVAAIRPHPNQFDGAGQMCTPESLAHFRGGLCSDRRLYVHAVCRAGQHLKRRAFERLGLWMVRVGPGDAPDVRAAVPPGLPCSGGAWRQDHTARPGSA